MNRRGYRSSIPKNAREVVQDRHENGAIKETFYFVGEQKVGKRWWHENGEIEGEYGLKDDRKHGTEFHFNDSGALTFMEPFRNGKIHGTARQWSQIDGRLLITYTIRHGVGIDLWCDDDGSLAEVHYMPDDGEVGHIQWWNRDNETVFLEQYYVLGYSFHGISREWNDNGRLSRGFPQYLVNGKKVTKRQYIRACQSDRLLIPFRPEDNEPYRELPPEYLAQRGRMGS
jgi:hypothetical protein